MPAFALSEPDAGSDAAAIVTTAVKSGDFYEINGRKKWTSNVGSADVYLVFANSADGPSIFGVDGDASGIILDERIKVMSPHTVGIWTLDSCRVPGTAIVGRPGDGLKIGLASLELFRPTVAAAAVGFARKALDAALQHCLERRAFKKPISEHQLVQAKLANMKVKIDAAALLTYRAAWLHDVGEKIPQEAAIAKYFATEAAFEVVDEAVQLFGGIGVTAGNIAERLYRHVRAFRIFDGTSEIQQLIIARTILKQNPSNL